MRMVLEGEGSIQDRYGIVHQCKVQVLEHHPGFFTVVLKDLKPPMPELEGQVYGGTLEGSLEVALRYLKGTPKVSPGYISWEEMLKRLLR